MTAEDLLARTLREITEETHYPTTPVATVATRARRIRTRHRRTATLAAAAAVAAVAVPGAVWLNHSPDASPTPSHQPSSGPTRPPTVALSSLAQGRPPGIDYLVGDTYVAMSGVRTRDPRLATATAATPIGAGLLFAVPQKDPGVADLWVHTQAGDHRLGCGRAHFAMSDDGVQSAYWVMDSCSASTAGKLYTGANNTMGEGGQGFVPTPAGVVIDPVGIQPDSVVVNAWRGQEPTAELVDPYSGRATRLSALRIVTGSDENNRVVSGELAGQPAGQVGESAVVDAHTGEVNWRTDWQLGAFSTDGKYVVGMRAGQGTPDTYAIFDAVTGRRLTVLPLHRGWVVRQVAWDGSDTVLAVVDADSSEAVVRFDLQGNLNRTTPVIGSAADRYRLATRP